MTTFKERYKSIIESGLYNGKPTKEKITALAQLIYANDRTADTIDCVCQALDEYEMMTGKFYDPTEDDLNDIVWSII